MSPPPGRGLLVEGAAEVATLAGGLRRGPAQAEPATLRAASDGPLAVACWQGNVLAVGREDDVVRQIAASGASLADFDRLDAGGGVVTPGLVDAHTHLLFAGSREREWQLRQRGASYLEILAAGGGILSTVAATRAASEDALLEHGRHWLREMLAHGTTTVEAKSGYGLDTAVELRLLDLAARLDAEGPLAVVPTFLGAHAVPGELRDRPDATEAYVGRVIDQQLPAVARQGIAHSCDVFCEQGVFSADQSSRILRAARRLGLAVRLHADELTPSGGPELAAELAAETAVDGAAELTMDRAGNVPRCLSADHLDAITPAGIAALASAAASGHPVVATLLPAASWFLMHGRYPPGRALVDAGVPVALATDFNPGTSPIASLPLTMTVACLELRLTPAEAITAVTINAAHALGLGDRIGSLEPGKRADLVVWGVPSVDQIPYWAGANLVRAVVVRGTCELGGAAVG